MCVYRVYGGDPCVTIDIMYMVLLSLAHIFPLSYLQLVYIKQHRSKKKYHVHSQKSFSSNGSCGIVCPSKHGIFPIEDFIPTALVGGLFCLLGLPMSQKLRKSLLFHTICCKSSLPELQIIPPSTAESDTLDKPIARQS